MDKVNDRSQFLTRVISKAINNQPKENTEIVDYLMEKREIVNFEYSGNEVIFYMILDFIR